MKRLHRKLRRAVLSKRKRRTPPHRPLYHLRDKNGKLPAYAWPGGYPIFYLTKEGDVLCPDCANKIGRNHDDPPIAHDANWEDPNLYCDDCSERIKSAYAEDDRA